MSFTEGGYSSVFGTGDYSISSGEYGADPLGGAIFEDWFNALLPSIILNETIMAAVPTADPTAVPATGPIEPVVISEVPVMGDDDTAPIVLPPVVTGPVGTTTVSPAVEPGAVWVEETTEEAVTWEDMPEWVRTPIEEPETVMPDWEIYGVAHDDQPGDDEVATTWMDIIGTVAQGYVGSLQPGVPPEGYPRAGGSPPARVTVDTRTGKVTPCRRRRRRRLLTPTDMADLASLQTLVGKGSDAMKFAVTKAVRR